MMTMIVDLYLGPRASHKCNNVFLLVVVALAPLVAPSPDTCLSSLD